MHLFTPAQAVLIIFLERSIFLLQLPHLFFLLSFLFEFVGCKYKQRGPVEITYSSTRTQASV